MFTQLLNKTAEVQSKSLTQNNIGETTESWTKKGSYPTKYEKNAQPRVIDDTYKVTLDDFIFFFDEGVEVNRDDRIVVDGKSFNVIASYAIDGRLSPHVEVFARYHDHD